MYYTRFSGILQGQGELFAGICGGRNACGRNDIVQKTIRSKPLTKIVFCGIISVSAYHKLCEKMGEHTPVCCGRSPHDSRSKTHRQDVSGQILSPRITRRRFYGRPGRGYRLLYQPQPTNFISMEYGISVCTPYALQVCLFASETVRDLMFFRRFRYLIA